MRLITTSLLGVLICFPALSTGRLPTVNVTNNAISARAAFGDNVSRTQNKKIVKISAPETNNIRNVVARTTKKKSVETNKKNTVIAGGDILSPKKPSINLWTNDEAPLRMPRANEFAVITSDEILPEEEISGITNSESRKFDKKIAMTDDNNIDTDIDLTEHLKKISSLDEQIARLKELQQRANTSVRTVKSDIKSVATNDVKQEKKVNRVVIPDDDVIVRSVEKKQSGRNAKSRIAEVREDMTKLSPSELRAAFRKTFLSENKHLSTMERDIDDDFDVLSDDMSYSPTDMFSESDSGIRPLEIKIRFRDDDSALSRENYILLTEYAGIVTGRPSDSIQISIPQSLTINDDGRKLAARRLSIIEQVLRDNGISEHRIMPVLANRNDDGLLLRIIDNNRYETLTQQQKNIFGDVVKKKTYKSMSW